MGLVLIQNADGTYDLGPTAGWPKIHNLSASLMAEMAMAGAVKFVEGDAERVLFAMSSGRTATYKIVGRPGFDLEQPDAWVLEFEDEEDVSKSRGSRKEGAK